MAKIQVHGLFIYKKGFVMNYRGLIGTEIIVEGERMKVTDYCRGCRNIWAESDHHKWYLGVGDNDKIYIKSKKLKPLQ